MMQEVPSPLGHWLAILAANLGTLMILVGAAAQLISATVRVVSRFVVARLFGLIFVLLGVSFVTFLLGYVSPGTSVDVICGEHCTPDRIRELEHFYHLDLPWYEQYAAYLNSLLHFDLGTSISHHGSSVWDLIGSRVPVSAELGLLGLGLQLVIGVPWGVLAAVRAGSRFIPGIGYYAYQSIQDLDMPVIQGITLVVAASVTSMNTVVDLLYGVADPRVKLHHR